MPQYLTFTLGAQEYGVDILHVQEIRGYTPATPVPNTPPYVRGVLNLRGTIVPIVDLRRRLGLPATDPGKFTVIVVLNVGTKVVGAVVDTVSDVLQIDDPPQAPPAFGGDVDARAIAGIVQSGTALVVLLAVEALLEPTAMVLGEPAGGPTA